MKQSTLGQRIKAGRTKMKLTGEALALRLGVTKGAVSQWENDHTPPGRDMLAALARIFGVSVEYLTTGINTPMYTGDDEAALCTAFRAMEPDVQRAFLLIGQSLTAQAASL